MMFEQTRIDLNDVVVFRDRPVRAVIAGGAIVYWGLFSQTLEISVDRIVAIEPRITHVDFPERDVVRVRVYTSDHRSEFYPDFRYSFSWCAIAHCRTTASLANSIGKTPSTRITPELHCRRPMDTPLVRHRDRLTEC